MENKEEIIINVDVKKPKVKKPLSEEQREKQMLETMYEINMEIKKTHVMFEYAKIIDENQIFSPKLGAKQHSDGRITSPPLEDLSPFLSKDILKENMIIDLIEE